MVTGSCLAPSAIIMRSSIPFSVNITPLRSMRMPPPPSRTLGTREQLIEYNRAVARLLNPIWESRYLHSDNQESAKIA